jgi:hypothetical protein
MVLRLMLAHPPHHFHIVFHNVFSSIPHFHPARSVSPGAGLGMIPEFIFRNEMSFAAF